MRSAPAADASSAGPADRRHVVVGRITGVFGVKGWVRVYSYTDPPDNILDYGPWLLEGPGRSSIHRVDDGAAHGRGIIAHVEGIEDRDAARALIGSSIAVPRERFHGAEEGCYFWSDLVGLRVVNGSGVDLGIVEELIETGANDVLVVRGERRRLVPFVPGRVVTSVDTGGGTIRVDWEADY
jgi:16S rRNA processing protein RimM